MNTSYASSHTIYFGKQNPDHIISMFSDINKFQNVNIQFENVLRTSLCASVTSKLLNLYLPSTTNIKEISHVKTNPHRGK